VLHPPGSTLNVETPVEERIAHNVATARAFTSASKAIRLRRPLQLQPSHIEDDEQQESRYCSPRSSRFSSLGQSAGVVGSGYFSSASSPLNSPGRSIKCKWEPGDLTDHNVNHFLLTKSLLDRAKQQGIPGPLKPGDFLYPSATLSCTLPQWVSHRLRIYLLHSPNRRTWHHPLQAQQTDRCRHRSSLGRSSDGRHLRRQSKKVASYSVVVRTFKQLPGQYVRVYLNVTNVSKLSGIPHCSISIQPTNPQGDPIAAVG